MTNSVSSRVAAFFDLDLTLLGVNSARLWVQHERETGRLGWHQVVEAAVWFAGYRLGLLNAEVGIVRAASLLKGRPEVELAEDTRAWFEDKIAGTLLEEGRRTVEAHRAEGHHVVLLTSSSPYLGRLVQAELGLDDVLCTHFEVKNGRFTGRVVPPVCFGRGKVTAATQWARSRGVDLAESHFYTDSHTDLPMLEAVGHPHVVNPDPPLARIARRRGWPVSRWKGAHESRHSSGE